MAAVFPGFAPVGAHLPLVGYLGALGGDGEAEAPADLAPEAPGLAVDAKGQLDQAAGVAGVAVPQPVRHDAAEEPADQLRRHGAGEGVGIRAGKGGGLPGLGGVAPLLPLITEAAALCVQMEAEGFSHAHHLARQLGDDRELLLQDAHHVRVGDAARGIRDFAAEEMVEAGDGDLAGHGVGIVAGVAAVFPAAAAVGAHLPLVAEALADALRMEGEGLAHAAGEVRRLHAHRDGQLAEGRVPQLEGVSGAVGAVVLIVDPQQGVVPGGELHGVVFPLRRAYAPEDRRPVQVKLTVVIIPSICIAALAEDPEFKAEDGGLRGTYVDVDPGRGARNACIAALDKDAGIVLLRRPAIGVGVREMQGAALRVDGAVHGGQAVHAHRVGVQHLPAAAGDPAAVVIFQPGLGDADGHGVRLVAGGAGIRPILAVRAVLPLVAAHTGEDHAEHGGLAEVTGVVRGLGEDLEDVLQLDAPVGVDIAGVAEGAPPHVVRRGTVDRDGGEVRRVELISAGDDDVEAQIVFPGRIQGGSAVVQAVVVAAALIGEAGVGVCRGNAVLHGVIDVPAALLRADSAAGDGVVQGQARLRSGGARGEVHRALVVGDGDGIIHLGPVEHGDDGLARNRGIGDGGGPEGEGLRRLLIADFHS